MHDDFIITHYCLSSSVFMVSTQTKKFKQIYNVKIQCHHEIEIIFKIFKIFKTCENEKKR